MLLLPVMGATLWSLSRNRLAQASTPLLHQSASPERDAPERQYLAAASVAMSAMMRDMMAPPSGDVDRDFVAGMIPHHQAAIDMAEALLRTGRNERLKRLAQEIIITQQEEIAAMRLAVAEPQLPQSR
jgi:uncharacterized protein (DUF305 family)